MVQDLVEAQERTEQRVNELVEAQKRTEQRVNELVEAQKRTEQRVNELAEAQKRTEEEIRKLTAGQKNIREQLGGLAHTVGYRLEDESFKALPGLLKKDFGIEITGRLRRDFIEIGKGRYIEVNIWGEGRKNGKEYVIIGDAKSQLKKRDIDEFIKKINQIKTLVPKEQVNLIVTYIAPPQIQKYAQEKNIKIYFSYEFY
ncbi:MAG: hypothetical protein KBE27_06255 [Syntrophorhabdaceae bacterium]|nr:hypothetical protein [Syntrophorhabdaceae bacterium]